MSARAAADTGAVTPSARGATARERTRDALHALGLFVLVFWFQVGHMIEHLSLAFRGQPLFGAEADSQFFHFVFNSAIAVLSVVIALRYPRNPWVYPLALIALMHATEDLYVYARFILATGSLNGIITEGEAGLLGSDGALRVLPFKQVDLHNLYNGLEWVLVTLGFWYQLEEHLRDAGTEAPAGEASRS